MSAIPHETPAGPEGPLVVPDKYVVKLTVAGQILRATDGSGMMQAPPHNGSAFGGLS
jgi:hypothetical protein